MPIHDGARGSSEIVLGCAASARGPITSASVASLGSPICDTPLVVASQDGNERPSGRVTFLFTDVEGSTRLWAADSDPMSASLLVHDRILRGVIESHYGCVFTTADDSFASAFARASDAAAAQQELAAAASPGPVLRAELTRRGRD